MKLDCSQEPSVWARFNEELQKLEVPTRRCNKGHVEVLRQFLPPIRLFDGDVSLATNSLVGDSSPISQSSVFSSECSKSAYLFSMLSRSKSKTTSYCRQLRILSRPRYHAKKGKFPRRSVETEALLAFASTDKKAQAPVLFSKCAFGVVDC